MLRPWNTFAKIVKYDTKKIMLASLASTSLTININSEGLKYILGFGMRFAAAPEANTKVERRQVGSERS